MLRTDTAGENENPTRCIFSNSLNFDQWFGTLGGEAAFSMSAYQESLRDVVAEQSATNAKLVVCLDNNTKFLEECRDELRYPRRRTRK